MGSQPSFARVVGSVAFEADVCVLLRQSGKQTLMVRWDLTTDTFELGQWLFHRISAGHLSPDGQLFAYQVSNSKPRLLYNAVSRPPFFTALAYWEIKSDLSSPLHWTKKPLVELVPPPTKGDLPHCMRTNLSYTGGYLPWQRSSTIPNTCHGHLARTWIGKAGWRYSLDDHPLDVDWADLDHRGRLLLARQGKIFVRDAAGERELVDLNPLAFRELPPPAWALEWP